MSDAQNNEEQKVLLDPPAELTDESFMQLLLQDLVDNNQPYLNDVAARHKLSFEKETQAVLSLAYEEQLGVVAENCISNALDENTQASYELLQRVCYFSENDLTYIAAAEGENAPTQMTKYIEERLGGVRNLKPVIDFTHSINEALLYSMGDYPDFTSYKANQLKERVESTDVYLSDEERAKVYFIASKLYRKLDAKANPYSDNLAEGQETDCLKKVLALSADYKLISYCQNRLPEKDNEKNVVRAYKRALTKKQSRGNSYKINKELADIYLRRSRQIGYAAPNTDKVISAEKAIRHLMGAYRFAQKEDRLPLLKKVADTQMLLGRNEEWKNTKEVIAMKFLKGQERCMALIGIADKTRDVAFYQKAVDEAEKMRMSKSAKLEVKELAFSKIVEVSKDDGVRKSANDALSAVRLEKMQEYNALLGKGLRR